jgi:hypothetical protein
MCVPSFSSFIERDPVHSAWAPSLLTHVGRRALDWSKGRVALAPVQLLGVGHHGLYDLEQDGDRRFRWTNGQAVVTLAVPPGVRPESLTVRLRPAPVRGQRLRVLLNGVRVLDQKVGPAGLTATARVPAAIGAGELSIRLESTTFRVPGDGRDLGVCLEALELSHTGAATASPEPEGLPAGPWYRDGDWTREVLLQDPSRLRGLYFTGGEPMLEKQVELVLDHLIEHGAAGHVTIEMNTNCTVLREPLLEKLLRFRQVTLGLSIDAVGDCFEYIRYPARWQTVRRNVERLVGLAGERLALSATVVLQAYNVLDLVSALEFFDGHGIPFNVQFATRPWFLGVGVLPASVRATAAGRLRRYAEGPCRPPMRDQALAVARGIETVKDQCSPEALRTLMLFSNDLDVTRQQDVRAVHGELLRMLHAEGFHWTDELSLAKAG